LVVFWVLSLVLSVGHVTLSLVLVQVVKTGKSRLY
jgi:hypothetical protein